VGLSRQGFSRRACDKVYEFRNNKIIEHYRGVIYDFLRKKKLQNLKDIEIKEKASQQNPGMKK
jgi:hypothetical protein